MNDSFYSILVFIGLLFGGIILAASWAERETNARERQQKTYDAISNGIGTHANSE